LGKARLWVKYVHNFNYCLLVQGLGYGDAPLLATGELGRITVHPVLQSHHFEIFLAFFSDRFVYGFSGRG
jgi:hypothetical protein